MMGEYSCQLNIDVRSTRLRQRLCDLILRGLRKIDPDRMYSTIEMQSLPVVDREVKRECLKKGYELACKLLQEELRIQSIESVAAKLIPNLWTPRAMK
jgi:hypothetical protein